MTEHSIEELKRQYHEAEGRLENAKQKRKEAAQRLSDAAIMHADAEFAARGITPGTVVVSKSRWDHRNGKPGIFVGHEPSFWRPWEPSPVVMKLKKDGTASKFQQRGDDWQKLDDQESKA